MSEQEDLSSVGSKRQKTDSMELVEQDAPSKMSTQNEFANTTHKLSTSIDCQSEERVRSLSGNVSQRGDSKEANKRQAEVEGKDRLVIAIEILLKLKSSPHLSNYPTVVHCHSLLDSEYQSFPSGARSALADLYVQVYKAYSALQITGEKEREVLLKQVEVLDTLIEIYKLTDLAAAAPVSNLKAKFLM